MSLAVRGSGRPGGRCGTHARSGVPTRALSGCSAPERQVATAASGRPRRSPREMRDRELEPLIVQAAPQRVTGRCVGQLGFSPPQLACLAEQIGGDARITSLSRGAARLVNCASTAPSTRSSRSAIAAPTSDERADAPAVPSALRNRENMGWTVFSADGGGSPTADRSTDRA